ncbi:hypothetical conserved protein [Oceanobacillus iheyensis HTE831]|uniref:Hypothetical conserved protein n=1 Tax=Oceanobacillus iheyensis (strain DSM 14371 / CIP 107618 / JCM 11309 / KCTC 3954 / HTE831) TaxID=221109 RepID=Q8ENF5_OCEIH|nr:TasA family protein [Oceanobacillus iheyensis]BAC14484.1 hypothetical conserved protein [Oceanobacillus iheyensis HTE831]
MKQYKQKILIGVAAGMIGMGFVGGGTFAFFSDTETTQNSFVSGTLDLELQSPNESGELDIALKDIKPGDKKTYSINLHNAGSLTFKDVLLTSTYSIKDKHNDNKKADFADHIFVKITNKDSDDVISDYIPISELKDVTLAEGQVSESTTKLQFDFWFKDNEGDQNMFQGDELKFDLIFHASQEKAE